MEMTKEEKKVLKKWIEDLEYRSWYPMYVEEVRKRSKERLEVLKKLLDKVENI